MWTPVRVWPCMVTCGRPLVGHSDWINSHQKHAGDWVACSSTHRHARPRESNIAAMAAILDMKSAATACLAWWRALMSHPCWMMDGKPNMYTWSEKQGNGKLVLGQERPLMKRGDYVDMYSSIRSASKLLDTFGVICQRSRGKDRWGLCSFVLQRQPDTCIL